MEKPEESGKQTAKKIIKKYYKIRREKAYQKLVDITNHNQFLMKAELNKF